MKRRDLMIMTFLGMPLAQLATSKAAVASPGQGLAAAEYKLPDAMHTHEIALVDPSLLVVSQMDTSSLVKVRLDAHGNPTDSVPHRLGKPQSGLHGLCNSTAYPGMVWCTLEYDSMLLLIDPHPEDLSIAPEVLQTIQLPEEAKDPHGIIEIGDDLWLGLKKTDGVLRINHQDPALWTLYPTPGLPAFTAQHQATGDIYVSLDQASKIMRIETGSVAGDPPDSTPIHFIDIPAEYGNTPVGLITSDVGIWFTLAGDATGGTGTFGRIADGNDVSWFTLRSPETAMQGLLHLGFDNADWPALWLLSTSLLNPAGTDGVVKVTFDPYYSYIDQEEFIALPMQASKAHRVLPMGNTIFATELSTARLAIVEDAVSVRA